MVIGKTDKIIIEVKNNSSELLSCASPQEEPPLQQIAEAASGERSVDENSAPIKNMSDYIPQKEEKQSKDLEIRRIMSRIP